MNYSKQRKIKQIIVSFLISFKVFAQQGAPAGDVASLATQKKYFSETYQGVFKTEEITNIEKIDDKHSKIYYTRSNKDFEAIVSSYKLLLVANCEQITIDKLPAIIKDNFKKSKYGNLKIEKAFIASNNISADFYRIDVYLNDKNKKHIKSLFYTDIGGYMKPPY